jgi:hypothetical protein
MMPKFKEGIVSISMSLFKEVFKLRGIVCRRIIRAASLNDVWSMRRFQYLNRYLFEMVMSKGISAKFKGLGKKTLLKECLECEGTGYQILKSRHTFKTSRLSRGKLKCTYI